MNRAAIGFKRDLANRRFFTPKTHRGLRAATLWSRWPSRLAGHPASRYVGTGMTGMGGTALDGASMGLAWALPFAGLLLSIASGPLLFPVFWQRNYAVIALGWCASAVAALATAYGFETAFAALVHALVGDYLSFVIPIFTLYTVAGGILVRGGLGGAPVGNTAVLGVGTLLASVASTTGAAMVLVRPLIRANAKREHRTHVVIFFIILVCNIGGALTPLGDPPLFAGFLHGVHFFWPALNVWMQTAIVAIPLLILFLALDMRLYRKGDAAAREAGACRFRIEGAINILLLGVIVASILWSAFWRPNARFSIYGTPVELQNLIRDALLLATAGLSVWLTPKTHRQANDFTWEPIREVAVLFAAIFVTLVPLLAMLAAGRDGAFGWLSAAVTGPDGTPHEAAYFWLAGLLSAFLDNVPTYLAFFQLAGGDADQLMGRLAGTLASISMGAVYMGGLTYIGNAPNFMVYAIARERGIEMPDFFGYVLRAGAVLLPLFALLTLLPISPILRWR